MRGMNSANRCKQDIRLLCPSFRTSPRPPGGPGPGVWAPSRASSGSPAKHRTLSRVCATHFTCHPHPLLTASPLPCTPPKRPTPPGHDPRRPKSEASRQPCLRKSSEGSELCPSGSIKVPVRTGYATCQTCTLRPRWCSLEDVIKQLPPLSGKRIHSLNLTKSNVITGLFALRPRPQLRPNTAHSPTSQARRQGRAARTFGPIDKLEQHELPAGQGHMNRTGSISWCCGKDFE